MTEKPAKRKGRLVFAIVGAAIALLLGVGLIWVNAERLFGRAPTESEQRAFAEQIKSIRAGQRWKPARDDRPRLTREMLLESARLGCASLAANQRPAGNFNYEYNFVTRAQSTSDNHVRQAGALWGLATCYGLERDEKNRAAVERGIDFFRRNSKLRGDGALIPYYPGQMTVASGAVALVSLAIIDYLRVAQDLSPQRHRELNDALNGYLTFLQSLQFKAGNFSFGLVRGLNLEIGRGSSYFDGETLLAMSKAAKYVGRRDLLPIVEKAAARTAPKYTVEAWRDNADSDQTKGFYQWGSMAFWEYQDAGWPHAETYADATLALAWWVIYTHHVSTRTRNTGYAFEGLIHAYLIARKRGDEAAASRLFRTIDRGLYQLTTWQVGGPLAAKNRFLRAHRTSDPLAVGAIMNYPDRPELRIDVTQHQIHAVLLALEYLYPARPSP